MKKETITVALKALKVNPKNEKVHTRDNLRLIAASMDEFGYVNHIIVDEHMEILAGHGRKIVLEERKVKDVEVIRLTGLSNAQKHKFRLYDNQTARTGYMDDELVIETVDEILKEDNEFNLSVLAIDELIATFSDEAANIDLGKAVLEKAPSMEKKEALFIFDEGNLVEKFLRDNAIKYKKVGYR